MARNPPFREPHAPGFLALLPRPLTSGTKPLKLDDENLDKMHVEARAMIQEQLDYWAVQLSRIKRLEEAVSQIPNPKRRYTKRIEPVVQVMRDKLETAIKVFIWSQHKVGPVMGKKKLPTRTIMIRSLAWTEDCTKNLIAVNDAADFLQEGLIIHLCTNQHPLADLLKFVYVADAAKHVPGLNLARHILLEKDMERLLSKQPKEEDAAGEDPHEEEPEEEEPKEEEPKEEEPKEEEPKEQEPKKD
jgi:hypothetical protein